MADAVVSDATEYDPVPAVAVTDPRQALEHHVGEEEGSVLPGLRFASTPRGWSAWVNCSSTSSRVDDAPAPVGPGHATAQLSAGPPTGVGDGSRDWLDR